MKTYKLYLPTKPYLHKYLRRVYGNPSLPGTPIVIDPATDFGDMIITKMSSTLHCNLDKHDIDVRMNRLTEKLVIHVPIHWWYKLGCMELTPHQVIRINRYFENLFESEMHQVVHRANTWLGIDRQVAIECFAENHDIVIEQDITFEGLKKMEYRHRKGSRHQIQQNIVQGLTQQLALFG